MTEHAFGELKRATVSAIITRADGTIEDLGVIADTHPDSGAEAVDGIQSKERKTLGDLSKEPNTHAQQLFDAWPTAGLEGLLTWLSVQNVDANVEPHTTILERIEGDAERGHPFAKRALGKD